MRIGILGGSFDPVHFGHLLLAECCRQDCRLDQVWFVPTAVAPHKQEQQAASAAARVEMLELATAGHPAFHIATLETQRGGVSYSVETLEIIAKENPGSQLFLLMGADTLNDLPNWRQPERIGELALPVVVSRYGAPDPHWDPLEGVLDKHRFDEARQYQVRMPRIELSSSEIRQRVASGKSIRYWTPRAVEKYIHTHRLYAALRAPNS